MSPNLSPEDQEKDVQTSGSQFSDMGSLEANFSDPSSVASFANTGDSTNGDRSPLQESFQHPKNELLSVSGSVHTAHTSAGFKDFSSGYAESKRENDRTGRHAPDPNANVSPVHTERGGIGSSQQSGTPRKRKIGSRWDFSGADVVKPVDLSVFGGVPYTGYGSTFVERVLEETPTVGTNFALQPRYRIAQSDEELIALHDCTASGNQPDGSEAHTAREEAPDLWTPYEPNPLPKYEPLQDVPVARVQQCLDTLCSTWGLHKSPERMDALQEIYAKCKDDMVLIHVKLYNYSKTLPQSSARGIVPPGAQALVERIKAIWENIDQALKVCLHPYSDWWTTKQRKNRIENLEEALKSARRELSEIFREAGKLLAESQGQGV